MKKVAIVMGSDSDLGVMEKAAKKLEPKEKKQTCRKPES